MISWLDFLACAFLRLFASLLGKLKEEQALALGAGLGRAAFYFSGRRSLHCRH